MYRKATTWGTDSKSLQSGEVPNGLLIAPSRLPQFAVEKCIGNLLNGEQIQNPANWGSTEISYTGKTPDC